MILISHRGNINGPCEETENKPENIEQILKKYNVEIDIWHKDGKLYLGHDYPKYEIEKDFLLQDGLWCHAKNLEALQFLKENGNIHFFWHQNDDYTITSRGYIWAFPGKELSDDSICVLPELNEYKIGKAMGICTDYINKFI